MTLAKREPVEIAQPAVQAPSSQAMALSNNPLVPRIQLAMMYKRNVPEFKLALREEATEEPTGMVYRKPQGDGHLLGPSVRLAEIAVRLFGNVDVAPPDIEVEDDYVTVTVRALDLQSNVSITGMASGSLCDRQGRRVRADVRSNLIAAAAAKARRNAVFQLIGKAVFDDLVKACLQAEEKILAAQQQAEKATGKTGTIWAKHVTGWGKIGISEADLLRACGVSSSNDVTAKSLTFLNAALQSVKEGMGARIALGLDVADEPEREQESNDIEDFLDERSRE
jgi:hypothetical protein